MMKKIIVGAVASAMINCLIDHVVDWCIFRALGMRCPREAG